MYTHNTKKSAWQLQEEHNRERNVAHDNLTKTKRELKEQKKKNDKLEKKAEEAKEEINRLEGALSDEKQQHATTKGLLESKTSAFNAKVKKIKEMKGIEKELR